MIDETFDDFAVPVSEPDAATILPEHGLWHACIAQAVRGAQRGLKEDYYWCFSEGHGVGSFKWICDMLDIDYLALREQIILKHATVQGDKNTLNAAELIYPEQLLQSKNLA